MTPIKLNGVSVPYNLIHIRHPETEPNSMPGVPSSPYAAKGGMTVSYLLRRSESGYLFVVCGVAVCSSEDNFNKRLGSEISRNRLERAIKYQMTEGLCIELPLGSVDSFEVDPAVFEPIEGTTYVSAREDKFPIQDLVCAAVQEFVEEYRLETYEGQNALEGVGEFDEDLDDVDSDEDDEDDEESDEESDEDETEGLDPTTGAPLNFEQDEATGTPPDEIAHVQV